MSFLTYVVIIHEFDDFDTWIFQNKSHSKRFGTDTVYFDKSMRYNISAVTRMDESFELKCDFLPESEFESFACDWIAYKHFCVIYVCLFTLMALVTNHKM